ncbi:MAG: hypothetical protein GY765_38310, partial [bacterium]|nr:hypothetical protein [bacterium]
DIRFRLASLYEALGDNKTGKRRTTFFTKAQALCLETIKKYPGAYGSLQCRHLATEFECTNLSIEIETVNPVDTSILAKLGYLNTDTVHLKIFKLTRAEKINLCDENGRFERNESTPAYFLDKTPLRHWQINPPMSNDFNLHSLEIKIDGGSSKPGLPQGEYALLVSDKNKQDPKTGPVAFSFFSVSNIAYIQRNMRDKKNAMNLEFHILHRVGGQPLPHARVQVWNRHKDKENETETYKRGELLSADKNGFLSTPRGKHYNFHLEFIHDRDRLFPIHLFYNRSDHTPQPKRQKAHFFTDRAIYRPGQTIYFKGLLMELDDENNANHRILKNCKIPVYFYDVNYEKIAQLDLVTNQYGTFNGTFNAPLGKLNGKMTITNIKIKDNYYYRDNGVQVSVEEYKRPKFQVTLLDREETEPGKMVFKGKARAYSGAAIDNAEVVYRVKRYSKYLETASGKTVTAADGSFTIEFTDTKRNDLFCTYTVNVDVTDVNGETRSAEKQYYYGEPGLDLDMSVPQCVNRDANQLTVTITTRDRTGAFRAAKGKIEVFKLRTPARPFRRRPWSKPERIQPTPREFRDLFPVDTYGNEARMWNNSQKGDKPIYTATFDTGKKKRFILSGLQKWKSGRYTVRINAAGSIDGYSPSREFILYSGSSRQMPFITPNWFHVEKSKAEPGENAVIYIGSSFPDVHLIYETGCRGQREKKGYFKLNRSKRKILIPIRTHHRGGMEVHLTFVKHNRVYHREVVIQVPWTNKKLDISFSTFRNKLQPGAKEEWRLKIRGPKGSPWTLSLFAAEMVATLYDASLDTFVPHLWSFDIFSNHGYVSFDDWEKKNNFGIAATCVVGKLRNFIPYKNRSHDRLNWFGFGKKRLRSTKPLVAPMAIPDEIYDFDLNSNASGVGGVEGGVEGEIIESDSLEFGVDESGKAKDKNPVMPAPVKARTNLKETAFFKPSLRTTPQGDVFISFTIPESLTRWKMLGFAHTKDLRFGLISNELETRKELMVVPNTPRFFREGDRLFYTAKITSLHNKELSGKARLQLFDAATMQPVDNAFKCSAAARTFKIKKGQSVQVGWEIHIPENLDAVVCRAVASAGSFSDGEERAVPILKNRILVTESLPLPVKPLETRNFTFKKLLHSSASGTIRHHSLTLEFTANPLWYVVQALPYLVEYPWECMEQTFSRYYANRIASFIANSNPKIKTTLEAWKAASGNSANANALLSNLEKNKELKSLLLQETPWVRQGRDESQRKRQIARLFEKEKLDASMKRALNKLKDGQLPSGAWPWFKGMKPSPYITRHIICGFAHMMQLQVFSAAEQRDIVAMAKKAMPYLDGLLGEDYLELKKVFSKKGTLEMNHLQRGHIHYFYARSFFLESVPVESPFNIAFDYYYGQ